MSRSVNSLFCVYSLRSGEKGLTSHQAGIQTARITHIKCIFKRINVLAGLNGDKWNDSRNKFSLVDVIFAFLQTEECRRLRRDMF